MNFVFGLIVGVGVTLFAMNPQWLQWLGGALHWAGDYVEQQETVLLPDINATSE